MPITMVTALEIFSNPKDLAFTVSEKHVGIFRGPGHNGKPLLTTSGEVNFGTRQNAAEEVGRILMAIIPEMQRTLKDPTNPIGAIFGPEKGPDDKAEVLTEEMVHKIVAKLAESGEAYSYKLD